MLNYPFTKPDKDFRREILKLSRMYKLYNLGIVIPESYKEAFDELVVFHKSMKKFDFAGMECYLDKNNEVMLAFIKETETEFTGNKLYTTTGYMLSITKILHTALYMKDFLKIFIQDIIKRYIDSSENIIAGQLLSETCNRIQHFYKLKTTMMI